MTEPEPTDASPGSEDKIKVMQGRVERGERLYHPQDADEYATVLPPYQRSGDEPSPASRKNRRRGREDRNKESIRSNRL